MNSVLTGCKCAFWLAALAFMLEARTVMQNFDARTGQLATGAYHLTMTTSSAATTQNAYWKATSLQTSRLIGQARHAMEDADQAIKSANQTTNSLNRLVSNTDASLNGERGALPALRASVEHLDGSQAQIASESVLAVKSATLGLNRLADTLGDPAIRATLEDTSATASNVKRGTADIAKILDDLSHPSKPPAWLRALSVMLSILRGTALAGQSAPVFGK